MSLRESSSWSPDHSPCHAIDFTAMHPDEVVSVLQAINSAGPILENEMRDAFYYGLDYLAREAPEVATATYRTLAAHEDPKVRVAAAISIYSFAGFDKYRAFPVWTPLLSDGDWNVRQQAAESITWATNKGVINPTEADLLRSLIPGNPVREF